MFAEVHGTLVPHPGHEPHVAAADAYSLFVARSSALGCLSEPRAGASGGLWGMNDAGQDSPDPDGRRSRLAWFQVSLVDPMPADRPLPVQAFLACAADVVARLGTPDVRAVRLLLPIQALGVPRPAGATISILQNANWFVDCAPEARTPVEITMDTVRTPLNDASRDMLSWLRDLRQDICSWTGMEHQIVSSGDSDGDREAELRPGFPDHLWQGPARHRAVLRATLTEWSLDAVGWMSALLAEAAVECGVHDPMLLSVERSQDSSATAL